MIAEITVVPVGAEAASMRDYVDEAVEAIKDTGVRCQVTAMGTNVEGSFDDILRAFKAAHDACVAEGAPRVVAMLRIDHRMDKPERLQQEIDETEEEAAAPV
ncbi:MAG: MTH1187 family thiamine-binding protein [Myxococcales bacterium]